MGVYVPYLGDWWNITCGGPRLPAQTIDLASLKLETAKAPFATEHPAPTKTTLENEQPFGPDEFEIRRKLFFQQTVWPHPGYLPTLNPFSDPKKAQQHRATLGTCVCLQPS